MGKFNFRFLLIFGFVISFGIISSVSCIIAEFKSPTWKDMKLDDKMCYLPESHSFGYGIAALISLIAAQIIGNLLLIFSNCCSRSKHPLITSALLAFSWSSFGIAIILLSTSTSISKRQSYGEGWLDQECYLVKDGVYFGSAGLVLLTTACTICATIVFTTSKSTQSHKMPVGLLE